MLLAIALFYHTCCHGTSHTYATLANAYWSSWRSTASGGPKSHEIGIMWPCIWSKAANLGRTQIEVGEVRWSGGSRASDAEVVATVGANVQEIKQNLRKLVAQAASTNGNCDAKRGALSATPIFPMRCGAKAPAPWGSEQSTTAHVERIRPTPHHPYTCARGSGVQVEQQFPLQQFTIWSSPHQNQMSHNKNTCAPIRARASASSSCPKMSPTHRGPLPCLASGAMCVYGTSQRPRRHDCPKMGFRHMLPDGRWGGRPVSRSRRCRAPASPIRALWLCLLGAAPERQPPAPPSARLRQSGIKAQG